MEQTRLRPQTVINLPKQIGKQVNLYALAAGAAGVGVMALAEPAEAEIVYTPTHVNIAPNRTVGLDLNHDGSVDFTIRNLLYIYSTYARRDDLTIIPSLTTLGAVKRIVATLRRRRRKQRHFALVESL
jgi:hypothetical protein